jgi:branched-chain amino acid transport system ATP-binding protein
MLEVTGLNVRYGAIEAVRCLSVEVAAGEVVAILGANGAGKSSSLNAIAGLAPRSAGTIRWMATEVQGWPAHRLSRAGLALVPEGRRVFSPMSVTENLLLGCHNLSRHARVAAFETVHSLFPILATRGKVLAGWLSGGEQQMLAIGRALMASPRLVMMDEPLMGLSPALVDIVISAIVQIAAGGIGILIVEQNATAVLPVAARCLVLERGEMIFEGQPGDLAKNPLLVEAFLGESS